MQFLSKDGKFYRDKASGKFIAVPSPSNILNDNAWATIRRISDAGTGANYWAVGDTKSITINGKIGNTDVNQTINAFIIGFDHNAEKEGTNRIHFLIGKSDNNMCGMTDSNYDTSVSGSGWCSMQTVGDSWGWNNNYMRKTFLGNTGTPVAPVENTFLAALPADLRAEMKSCTKYSFDDEAHAVTSTIDYLFLLAEFEVFGALTHAYEEDNSQVQYDYFKAGNSKVAGSWESPATAVNWWLRSIDMEHSTGAYCVVYTSGEAGYYLANYSLGVLPGFCI